MTAPSTADPGAALAVYAHPDDPEISAGGTLARWAAEGAEVWVLVTTRGDKGTSDPDVDPEALAALRLDETAASVKVLGLAGHRHLDHGDGDLEDDRRCGARSAARARAAARGRALPGPDRGVLRRRLLQPPRPPGHRLGDARRDRAGGRAPHYFAEQMPRGSTCTTCAPSTCRGRSSRTAGSTSPTTLERKIDALFCHASQLDETGESFREFLRQRARSTPAARPASATPRASAASRSEPDPVGHGRAAARGLPLGHGAEDEDGDDADADRGDDRRR